MRSRVRARLERGRVASRWLGIVASRVVEVRRPTFVLGEENGVCVGSGRSIPGFHLLDALESMRELFAKFGGHSHAAGLTLSADDVDAFRERLNAHASARLTSEDLRPALEIDAVAKLSDLDDRFFAQLQLLEPFGSGNRSPVFAAMGLEVENEPRLMKEKHLRVNLRQGARVLNFKSASTSRAASTSSRRACALTLLLRWKRILIAVDGRRP